MAVTTVAKTVSASTGTFTTPQLWEDGAPANLTTSNNWTAGTFLVAAFIQGEAVTGVGVTGGKMLDTDSTGAGTGSYITFGTTTTPAVGATITGTTSGATCVLTGSANVGVIWQAQQKNEEFSGASNQLTVSGSTVSSTCYKEYTTFAGASFADNANKLTNALCYNAANGAAIVGTANTTTTIVPSENNFRMSKMQIAAIGVPSQAISGSAVSSHVIDRCIVEGTATAATTTAGVLRGITNGIYKNLLVIQRRTGADHIVGTGTATGVCFYNCTFVAADDLAAAPACIFASGASGDVTAQNCALFAGADKPTTAGSATYTFTTCYGDDSTPASGITTATFADSFVDVTNAARDFRLKTGSALLDTGTTDATNAPTDIVGTTRPQGSAYDVGCWELVAAAGSIVPVLYHHYQQQRMT